MNVVVALDSVQTASRVDRDWTAQAPSPRETDALIDSVDCYFRPRRLLCNNFVLVFVYQDTWDLVYRAKRYVASFVYVLMFIWVVYFLG